MFASGFFASVPVQTAIMVGGGAALVSAVVGVVTVMRGYAFAGHALADVSGAGGSASVLLGINPLLGFLAVAVAASLGLETLDSHRPRERDLVTGLVLGAGLGLSALLLYLTTTRTSTTGGAVTVLFGSMFAIPRAVIPLAAGVGLLALAVTVLTWRPMLLLCLDAELARARGVPVRLVGAAHLVALGMAASLAAMTVGAVLSTALLIGPAATAIRLTASPGRAALLAIALGLAATWGGIALAYASYEATHGHGWPVSVFVVGLTVAAYVGAACVRPRAAG